MTNVRVIYFWPDGTWCDYQDLMGCLRWKSDDFTVLHLPEDTSDSLVDSVVFERCSG